MSRKMKTIQGRKKPVRQRNGNGRIKKGYDKKDCTLEAKVLIDLD